MFVSPARPENKKNTMTIKDRSQCYVSGVASKLENVGIGCLGWIKSFKEIIVFESRIA